MNSILGSVLAVFVNIAVCFIVSFLFDPPTNIALAALSIVLIVVNIFVLLKVNYRERIQEVIRVIKDSPHPRALQDKLAEPENIGLESYNWESAKDSGYFTRIVKAKGCLVSKRLFLDKVNSINLIGITILVMVLVASFIIEDLELATLKTVVPVIGISIFGVFTFYLFFKEILPHRAYHITQTGIYLSKGNSLEEGHLVASLADIDCLQIIRYKLQYPFVVFYQLNIIKHEGERITLLSNSSKSEVEHDAELVSGMLGCDVIRLR